MTSLTWNIFLNNRAFRSFGNGNECHHLFQLFSVNKRGITSTCKGRISKVLFSSLKPNMLNTMKTKKIVVWIKLASQHLYQRGCFFPTFSKFWIFDNIKFPVTVFTINIRHKLFLLPFVFVFNRFGNGLWSNESDSVQKRSLQIVVRVTKCQQYDNYFSHQYIVLKRNMVHEYALGEPISHYSRQMTASICLTCRS